MTGGQQVGGDALRRLRAMEPLEFERFIAGLWSQQGWETEVTNATNDYGVDVRASKDDGMVRQTAAIQAKRYAEGNNVGRDEVQQYHAIRTQDPDVDTAVVVTTSSFTTPAEEWASEHGVRLVDGNDLVDTLRGMDDGYDLIEEYTDTVPEPEEDADREANDFELKSTLLLGTTLVGGLLIVTAATLDSSMSIRVGLGILGIILASSLPVWMAWATYDYKQKKRELETLKRNQ